VNDAVYLAVLLRDGSLDSYTVIVQDRTQMVDDLKALVFPPLIIDAAEICKIIEIKLGAVPEK
jgi:hypothetical protein